MKRRGGMAAILLVALVGAVVFALRPASPPRVFTVAEIQQELASHPRQWLNRTVLVRGVFQTWMSDPGVIDIFHPPSYILVTYALYQPAPSRAGGISGPPLMLKLAPHLAPAPASPLTMVLRVVPWLQGLLGRPGAPTFRVTLLAPSRGPCAGQACPDGQLDEQPW